MYAFNLNKLTAEDIMIFRQQNYNANNITGELFAGRVITFVLVSVIVTVIAVTSGYFSNSFFLFLLCNSSRLQRMIFSTSSPYIYSLKFIVI